MQLSATVGGGVTYEWFKDGSATPVKSGAEAFLDITVSGEYKVSAISESGTCSRESNVVTVTVTTPGTGLNQTIPDARSNSPVCTDNTLNLEVNDVGASEYRWRGPNGFSQTATTRTISRPNFTVQDAGLYIVEMVAGTCVAKTDSTIVEAVSIPDFSIAFSGEISAEANPANVYDNPNIFEVSLTVTYEGVQQCSATNSKMINTVTPVAPVITLLQ